MGFLDRIQHGWNAFMSRAPTTYSHSGAFSYYRPDRFRYTRGNERSIATSVYNRIAIDASSISMIHCKLDENGRFEEEVKSSLNNCLKVSANTDQSGRLFRQDIVQSMLDEGHVCIVPIETDIDPSATGSYNILSMRTGKVTEWYPDKVKVKVFNELTGKKEEVVLPKSMVAIVENPFYAIMNEPNSTLKRLVRKLSLLDMTDEQTASGKLDMIIQLPYAIKTQTRRDQAEERRKDIEMQLTNSKYGIAYIDGTEKITQLNRSLENNLLKQIETLQATFYSQLGITQSIMEGTADEQTMINYYSRVIEPILSAISEEMNRKFLTKTARTQGQSIMFYRDPFKLVPVNSIADIADKFTRNEIMTSNEVRQIIGMKPSKDPKADMLLNSNLNHDKNELNVNDNGADYYDEGGENQNG